MPRKAAEYPEWVMKYKTKGTYINKVGEKYYLYKAHSERIKETGKVRRVCDGYLGRITEQDGLITPKDKLAGASISAYELGMSYAVLSCTSNIHLGLRKSFVKYGDLVYVCSVLNYVFGLYTEELFNSSWLRFHFDSVEFPESFTEAQANGIIRGTRMITDTVNRYFGDDLPICRAYLSAVSLLKINDLFYLPSLSDSVLHWSQKYSIDWRNSLWQK